MHFSFRTHLAAGLICAALPWTAAQAEELPRLNLAPDVTVSGLSSGAFMAVQLEVAFSAAITGAGIVAGGPFGCAESHGTYPGSTHDAGTDPLAIRLWQATNICMISKEDAYRNLADDVPAQITQYSLDRIASMAADGQIDPIAGLADDKIYMFHGTKDSLVRGETMEELAQTYRQLGIPEAQIEFDKTVAAGHGFVTPNGETPCDGLNYPSFLNKCPVDGVQGKAFIDQAGAILTSLYGPLKAKVPPVPGNLRTYKDLPQAQNVTGMDSSVFVYIPKACQDGTVQCRLHIALHGCLQGRESRGDGYATKTGYNEWAEANDIVVLYPQAHSFKASDGTEAHSNFAGCWDWRGYSSEDYLSRTAPQMAVIAAMAAALGAPLDTQN